MRNAFLSAVPRRPPLCTPKTSAWPPPTCPASPRQRPSCSPKRGCRGVGLPVGTRRIPRPGGRDLLPRGSRWGAEVSKHEKSPSSGPMCHGKGRISQQRPQFLDYSENILFQALVKHSLDSRDAKKHQFTQFTHSVCSHCWPALTKQPWGDHGGGYGSDDRSSSQTLSNALENNQRIKPAKGLEKPCRACRQARYG